MIHFHEWNGESYYRNIITIPLEVQKPAKSVIVWKSWSLSDTPLLCSLPHSTGVIWQIMPLLCIPLSFLSRKYNNRIYCAVSVLTAELFTQDSLTCAGNKGRATGTPFWEQWTQRPSVSFRPWLLWQSLALYLQITLFWRQVSWKAIQMALGHSGG